MFRLLVAGLLVGLAPPPAAPLDGEALRRIFLTGYNTYLAEARSPDVITDHPSSELFRPNGTYARTRGALGPEGWYTIEGNLLCVSGDDISKLCRRLIPQGDNQYLVVDAASGSGAVLVLWQVK